MILIHHPRQCDGDPTEPEPPVQPLVMSAAWGTGKSHLRSVLLEAVIARERDASASAWYDWVLEHCHELPDDYEIPLNRY